MSEHLQWQQSTALKKIAEEQDEAGAPPLASSIAAAARYVGADIVTVERWWKGRGR